MPPPQPQSVEGSVEQALANGREMLRSHPDMALRQAQVLLSRDRGNLPALRLAAAAHRALGQGAFAERAEMVALELSNTVPALKAAAQALRDGQPGEASRLAAEVLRHQPDDLAALTLSAESAMALTLADEAEPLLRTVLARVPHFGHARYLLANALVLLDRLLEARQLLTEMLSDTPGDVSLLTMLAKTTSELGDFEGAVMIGEQLVQSGENPAENLTNYGDSLRFAGRKNEASQAYRKAIAADPHHGRAWWSLADLDPKAIEDQDIESMEQALEARNDLSEHAGNLHFALGIAHDAHGRPSQAFPHFAPGNALRRKAQPYDPSLLTAQLDRYLAHLPSEAVARRRPAAEGALTPIFIVGMPRSGSTLLERVLGRHSGIEALGELSIVPRMVERMKRQDPDTLEARICALDQAELAKHGAWYLARAAERRKTDRPFFVDKMHMNWRHLALILRMLPQAIIIDLRRDPMDCCWSNYKTLFARGHPAASDLRDIGLFYRDYARFTDELRSRAVGRILFASYENLVEDLAGTVRPMFDAMGLPFEPDVLEFHRSTEPVATASSEQVRRPLNRAGIGAWRPYEPWLDPLRNALGPLAND